MQASNPLPCVSLSPRRMNGISMRRNMSNDPEDPALKPTDNYDEVAVRRARELLWLRCLKTLGHTVFLNGSAAAEWDRDMRRKQPDCLLF